MIDEIFSALLTFWSKADILALHKITDSYSSYFHIIYSYTLKQVRRYLKGLGLGANIY